MKLQPHRLLNDKVNTECEGRWFAEAHMTALWLYGHAQAATLEFWFGFL